MAKTRKPSNSSLTRRRILAGAFGAGAIAALARIGGGTSFAEETGTGTTEATTTATAAGGTLPIPDRLDPTVEDGVSVFTLQAQTGTNTSLVSGETINTAGYNGTLLGPTMLVSDGEPVRFDVTNSLGEATTVHWHGLHIAPSADGGPQNLIKDGDTWSAATTINQGEACTLWYHPHGLGTTTEQVVLGLAGLLIVDDGSDANAALPTDYGANDVPLIMQSTAVTSAGAFATTNATFTASASTVKFLVNGMSATDETPTLEVAYGRVRLRLLNASITDSITLALTDSGSLTQVASDAGLLAEPISISSLRLSPGERAEIVLDLTAADDAVTLRATVRNTTNGTRYTVSMLTVSSTATEAADNLPGTLNTISDIDATDATTRTFTLSNSGATMLINGIAGTTMEIMDANAVMTTVGAIEQWTITNSSTNIYHNFHLHDVPFQVVSIGGSAPTGANTGWRDTIEVAPSTTVVIKMQFTDYSDNEYMYMLHCHNVIHEDEGMMLGLMVMS
ncbi:multicopper oxidase [Actinoplanes lobatus]|uniref:Multicopper oxidase CueO n=1 Tax=Actinoplanes lobatus TaxID=113568 RepID=A0A7W7HM32_9ACTN|nr:multicopper oxidase domain-containing protein [Actinoplanes lobatus]MBB4752965.1 suppressor of ftsI/bilirubin oxidase [Actinoplanes lobatus]GGN87694.1 multicopper oxidase [Actinoplanes lobatus]GIE39572.1 multicopper oxidase [Actinoplanes lobatus]